MRDNRFTDIAILGGFDPENGAPVVIVTVSQPSPQMSLYQARKVMEALGKVIEHMEKATPADLEAAKARMAGGEPPPTIPRYLPVGPEGEN